ncbi:hypothetical protein JHK87_043545 [Glycine soja]|nr:hypothetical protein JHK87_043545 [Glycine soja]
MVQEVEDLIGEMEKAFVSVDGHCVLGIVEMYVGEGDIDKVFDLLKKFLLTISVRLVKFVVKKLVRMFQMNGEMSSSICAAVMDVFAEKGLSEEAEDVFYKERNLAGWKKDVLECNFMIQSVWQSQTL